MVPLDYLLTVVKMDVCGHVPVWEVHVLYACMFARAHVYGGQRLVSARSSDALRLVF